MDSVDEVPDVTLYELRQACTFFGFDMVPKRLPNGVLWKIHDPNQVPGLFIRRDPGDYSE